MTKTRWLSGRSLPVLLAPLMLAGALIVTTPAAASAATCVSWTGLQPPNPGSAGNVLHGVAVLSACNAWAVGDYFNGTASQTLAEHWNGSAWTQAPSQDPAGSATDNVLLGVAATSASNVWAVGYYLNGSSEERTLIEHWNGRTWAQVRSPNPGSLVDILEGVTATSARNMWAVGNYANSSGGIKTLVLHWNGRAWRHVSSPNPASNSQLFGVHATSGSNAWAVGYFTNGPVLHTLVEHWNGRAWRHVKAPSPGSTINALFGVAATSARNAWAVGNYDNGSARQSLVLHWNGASWTRVKSPNPGGSANNNEILDVAATSSRNAWAVGDYFNGAATLTLVEHWNGKAWRHVASPNPASDNRLLGVAATSATNIWAVGSSSSDTLALHCC